ncbi:MAG: 1-deoxy-D-xylulose-5-phosphate synthase [Chloroflexota bacterium]
MRVLERFPHTDDLASLDMDALQELCSDVRSQLIETVTRTGGHLASNLGAVELTVALHRAFNSPTDRIVWDVGHQSYTHKLLTDRADRFHTLRQEGGLSGFPDPLESEHDAFVAGHAGTAVSVALGMATARDRAKQEHEVVAVVGDGCLTCGMTYEALNHLGHLGTRVIIVLNDNGMSISPTVGSMSRRLNMLRTGQTYSQFKKRTDAALRGVPSGGAVRALLRRFKAGAKAVVNPVMLFEDLGLTYLGPVDGHDIGDIEQALGRARTLDGPVVVHVMTRKGKGFEPAECDPTAYHGVSPLQTRDVPDSTYSDVFAEHLATLMEKDDRIVVVTAAMLDGTGVAASLEKFPGRVFDVGISEQHAVTFAAGMAAQGLRPVVAIYSTFLQRAFDQIVHDVCLPGLPVVFALDRAGIVGGDGKTHHGAFDIGYLGTIPGVRVVAPRDSEELRAMLEAALAENSPVAIRYPRASVADPVAEPVMRPYTTWGPALMREGQDVLIIATGSMIAPSLEAAERLAKDGISAGVLDARCAHPLDTDALLKHIEGYGTIVTVEEHVAANGFGARIRALVAQSGHATAQVLSLALPDEFVPHGNRHALLHALNLDADGIAATCLSAGRHVQAP